MQIFNTKTRKKETFKPLSSHGVKVYYCGPTVYNYAHIGNLRTYVFEDVVVKSLRFLGYKLITTMNITDVDDKTIRDSIKAGMSLKDFTQKYTEIFLRDIEKLGIQQADNVIPVTDLIPEMVRMIQTLLRKGHAYLAEDGSIYYKVSSFKGYGKFSGLKQEDLKENIRIDNDEYEKDNVSDFVLWKAWKEEDAENYWEEEFEICGKNDGGEKKILKGRPGWHIECSACNMKIYGAQIDIHMGGEDLVFPHHQNEIAQTEGCTGKEFSKYWLHSGHLMVEGKKMSKSLGNFYTLGDIEKKYHDVDSSVLYRAIRLSFLNGKYRESIDFSFRKLEACINVILHVDETLKNLHYYKDNGSSLGKEFRDDLQNFIQDYVACLEDDFNTVEALVLFHEFLKYANTGMTQKLFSESEVQSVLDLLSTFHEVLGLIDFSILSDQVIPDQVLELFEKRNQAKKEKDFSLSDALRDQISDLGYTIKDSRDGSRLEKC